MTLPQGQQRWREAKLLRLAEGLLDDDVATGAVTMEGGETPAVGGGVEEALIGRWVYEPILWL